MAEIFWIIITSPTFIIVIVVGFLILKSKGYLRFRAKKKFELEERRYPWEE